MENQEPLLISEESKTSKNKNKRDWKVELALFLILGVLLGIVIKTEAVKRITIGYEDYKASLGKQNYGINEIQKELEEKANEESVDTEPVPNTAEPSDGK